MKSTEYAELLKELSGLEHVPKDFQKVIQHPALIEGDSIPDYWCRVEEDGTCYLFLAQPLSKNLSYPVYSGQSYMNQSVFRELTITFNGKCIKQNFEFKPYQSLLLQISPRGKWKMMDISFVPENPVVRPREIQKTYF